MFLLTGEYEQILISGPSESLAITWITSALAIPVGLRVEAYILESQAMPHTVYHMYMYAWYHMYAFMYIRTCMWYIYIRI